MSIFFITVPTREYEVTLRQKELDLQHVHLEERRLSLLGVATPSNAESRASNASINAPDVYLGLQDGKQTEIIVSDDYMEIRRASIILTTESNEDAQIEAEIRKYFLEKHLEDCIERYELQPATTWSVSYGGKMSQVTFSVPADFSDVIIKRLHSVGVGVKYNSSITVCSADVYYGPKKSVDKPTDALEVSESEGGGGGDEERRKQSSSSWADFVKSIKSRLTVAQVVSQVQANAVITFDFLALVFVAAAMACLGLLEDSGVLLVASMLVSPLMGPIMAFTFGSMIRDCKLIKTGIKSEMVGLAVCALVGVISGILMVSFGDSVHGPWYYVKQWPTNEMTSRGRPHGSIVGCLMAVPSGIGVALSILAGNAGSLVGVAIAASLLPPAVNGGLLWGMSLSIAIQQASNGKGWSNKCNDFITANKSKDIEHAIHYVKHEEVYCKNAIWEFAILGSVSFGLTWINIILIFCVALAILKLKEVAPYTTKESLKRFWKEDLAYTRNYNIKHQNEDIHMGIMDDINNADNPEAVRANVEQDQTFRQINRRVGGGTMGGTKDILQDYKQGFNNVTGSEIQLPRLKKRASLSLHAKKSEKQGWFSSWFGSGKTSRKESIKPTGK